MSTLKTTNQLQNALLLHLSENFCTHAGLDWDLPNPAVFLFIPPVSHALIVRVWRRARRKSFTQYSALFTECHYCGVIVCVWRYNTTTGRLSILPFHLHFHRLLHCPGMTLRIIRFVFQDCMIAGTYNYLSGGYK